MIFLKIRHVILVIQDTIKKLVCLNNMKIKYNIYTIMSRRNSRSDSIDSDFSRKSSVDSRSYSFDSNSSNSGKIRTYSSDSKDVSGDKERLFIIPINNNSKSRRREREQSIDKVVAISPNIQNVMKYLQIFDKQQREAKMND